MRKKLLVLAIALVIIIAVPLAIAQVNQSTQSVHVNKKANYPVNTPAPTSSPDPTATPTAAPTAKFSLWFPNGTVMPSTLGGSFSDFPTYAMWMSPQAAGFGSGWQPTGLDTIVVRNDGNVPMNITVSAANVNVPSDIYFAFNSIGITPSGQMNSQIGPIAVGQSATVMLMTNMAPTTTSYTSNAAFSYSFDIVVSATQT